MTSYLRSWLASGLTSTSSSSTATNGTPGHVDVPTLARESPPPEGDNDEGSDTETERDRDDDSPPAFPSLNSAQRVRQKQPAATSSQLPRVLTDEQLMPPPPVPISRLPGVNRAAAPGSLAVPPTTIKRPTPASKKREKVALAPGHSPMDWANLKSSGQDLRGVPTLMRITPSMLKQHNKRDDAWAAFNGKVYNITHYLPFHPGGEKELMRVAGRDGTKLFALTHAWVNVDMMLDTCLVGFLIPEPSS
ncbi:cytochrome b5 [Macrolepiota fuliginosa MF-IS2]|uniref:Cytochrome b5 n=1 Tax=Macrolepiota fuliginosa MF-IS2 TaxID=1400762 RepID=A0A9P6C2Z7_9AGAR|nr:cytochrome b5 [Macrolepiota fuliginosa MF-IS2]